MKLPHLGFLTSTGKFAAVGIANNLIGYALFTVLSVMGASAIPAMTVSYCTGMVISFFGNRSFTFGHKGRQGPAIFRFLVVNAAGFALNAGILWFFVDVGRLPQILVQLGAIGCVAVLTFTMMRSWIFRNHASQRDTADV